MRWVSIILMAGFLIGQSPLVELSKKEKQRRKKEKAVKVITNEDLAKAPAPSVIVSGIGYSPSSAEGGKEEGQASRKKDKKWWASRKKKLEEKIASLKKRIEELQKKVNALTTGFLIEQRPMAHKRLKEELEKTKGELEKAKKELEKARKELDKLYEQARKAGIPPGWLR